MATYQIQGPGGAVYSVDGPDGADPSAVIQSLGAGKSAPANPNAPQGVLGEIALGGRELGEGVLDTLAAPSILQDSISNLISRASNRFLGTHRPMITPFSAKLSDALTQAGAPVPTTPNEQLASAAIRGGAGALTGLGVLGPLGVSTSAPNAIRAGLSGVTGGTSADIARQAGAGPAGQFVAGLAGGFTPAALEGGASAVSSLGGLARPFTRGGQAQLAANTLTRNVSNPTAAITNLSNAAPIVPGSLRTAGEASGDVGLLGLEKGVRARNMQAFGERISQQNAARQAELASVGGTPADIAAARALRTATTDPMRESALASGGTSDATPVVAKIDQILGSAAGKREVPNAALTWLRGKLQGVTDPATLYAVRQDLNDAMAGKLGGDLSKFKLARSQLIEARSALDDAIEQGAPGFKAYLAKYRDMSPPIDQMTAIQRLQQRASSGLDTATGQPFLSTPKFDAGLRALSEKSSGPTPLRLTPDQTTRLNAVREDLQRGNALSSPTVRAPGSDTFQNFMLSQRLRSLGNFAGHIPLVGKALRSAGEFVDQRVNAELSKAMLDPAYAAKLLQQGTLPKPVAASLRNMLAPYGVGGLLANSPYPALEAR